MRDTISGRNNMESNTPDGATQHNSYKHDDLVLLKERGGKAEESGWTLMPKNLMSSLRRHIFSLHGNLVGINKTLQWAKWIYDWCRSLPLEKLQSYDQIWWSFLIPYTHFPPFPQLLSSFHHCSKKMQEKEEVAENDRKEVGRWQWEGRCKVTFNCDASRQHTLFRRWIISVPMNHYLLSWRKLRSVLKETDKHTKWKYFLNEKTANPEMKHRVVGNIWRQNNGSVTAPPW